ncbi:MAG: RagB/SusD family nutrient uptake outer membrane protein [Tannerellaceae bacterium]|nr:RagB/SusD family nutrient uptake outer membrane protein [Tannerellaceae bacterium]
MQQIVTGIYATLNLAGTNSYTTYYYLAELASDDRFGGGGAGGKDQQGFDKFMNSSVDRMGAFWAARYKGINRANYALEVIDQLDGYAVNQKEHMLREIHFLRGFFYHELAEAFENVPLVLNTEAENLPQADVEDLYGQITYDLKKAIEILDGNFTTETNRITKWDAEALMARVFLFYTGFYQTETLPLGDGEGNVVGSVTKDKVIAWLEDCVFQSDRKLLPNFRSLWAYTNPYTAPYYKYLQENDPEVRWAGDGTAENTEKMFSISHTTMATWNETGFSNAYALFSVTGPEESPLSL